MAIHHTSSQSIRCIQVAPQVYFSYESPYGPTSTKGWSRVIVALLSFVVVVIVVVLVVVG